MAHLLQLYEKREILLRSRVGPIRASSGFSIAPGKDAKVTARFQVVDKNDMFDETAISWIYTNCCGFPLQPVITNYNATITITYTNNTQERQMIKKDSVLGYVDIRSKDGYLIDLQWLIPLSKQSDDYIFYGHTAFNNALAQQALAMEDNDKHNLNRFEVKTKKDKLVNPKTPVNSTDPYPRLDKDDP